MKNEMEIRKTHEEQPLQNHPVLSSMKLPEAEDTEAEIAKNQKQVLEEEGNSVGTVLDGVPSGEPGFSQDFLKDTKEVDASFLRALEKGTSKVMNDPGRDVESAVHRVYENQEFVGKEEDEEVEEEKEEVGTTEPKKLHLFNSSDLVLKDFMVKQLETQPGMRMKEETPDEEKSMLSASPDSLTLTHKQLE